MAVWIALMTSASQFGPVEAAMGAMCMLFVFPRNEWRRNLAIIAGLGALSAQQAMELFDTALVVDHPGVVAARLQAAAPPPPTKDQELLTEIRDLLRANGQTVKPGDVPAAKAAEGPA